MSIVILADRYLSAGFRLAGVEYCQVKDAEEARARFSELLKDERYKMIILPETLAEALREGRENLLKAGRIFPLLLVVPDLEGPRGLRERELHDLISRAVGAKLKLGD